MGYSVVKVDVVNYKQIDWSKIERAELISNNGGEAPYKTFFRLCHTDCSLFFRFEGEEDCVRATMTGYNEPIYDEETVEFFLCSDGDLHDYVEFEMNLIGGEFLAYAHNDLAGKVDLDYIPQGVMTTDALVKDGYFVAEGRIDKKIFHGKNNCEWLFNAYRIKRDNNNNMILMAYSPTLIDNFHVPNKFVKLKFL